MKTTMNAGSALAKFNTITLTSTAYCILYSSTIHMCGIRCGSAYWRWCYYNMLDGLCVCWCHIWNAQNTYTLKWNFLMSAIGSRARESHSHNHIETMCVSASIVYTTSLLHVCIVVLHHNIVSNSNHDLSTKVNDYSIFRGMRQDNFPVYSRYFGEFNDSAKNWMFLFHSIHCDETSERSVYIKIQLAENGW